MLLTKAIELVVADTRENTDPNMTILQAIESARECSVDDLTVIDSQELLDAYLMVVDSTDEQIERAAGLVIASL